MHSSNYFSRLDKKLCKSSTQTNLNKVIAIMHTKDTTLKEGHDQCFYTWSSALQFFIEREGGIEVSHRLQRLDLVPNKHAQGDSRDDQRPCIGVPWKSSLTDGAEKGGSLQQYYRTPSAMWLMTLLAACGGQRPTMARVAVASSWWPVSCRFTCSSLPWPCARPCPTSSTVTYSSRLSAV
jgi:hypothetical protein